MIDFLGPATNIVERAYFHLKEKKNQNAFYFDDQILNYEQALKKIESISRQIKNFDLCQGDSVLVLLPLSSELIFILLALMKQGIIPILIDPRLNKKFWRQSILNSNPKFVISSPQLIEWHWIIPWTWRFKFLSLNKKTFGAKLLDLNQKNSEIEISETLVPMKETDIIIKTLTSGSTGDPKIVSRSFSALEAQQRLSCKYLPPLVHDIHLSLYGIGILQSFIHGSTTIISNSFSSEQIYQQLSKHRATRLSIPPGMLWDLISYCEQNNLQITTLKCLLTGGAPIPLWFRSKLKQFFPTTECYIVYGSTECEPISKLNLNQFYEEKIVGYPVGKNIDELEVIKTPLTNVKDQMIYQISLKGPNCASLNEHGVLEIGDLASFDNEGRIWLLGRSNEIHNGIPFAYIEELTERIHGVKRALFLRKNETSYLFIETLNNVYSQDIFISSVREVQNTIIDLGLDKLEIYRVNKIPVDQRHLWKIQRQKVSSLLKDFCYDKLSL